MRVASRNLLLDFRLQVVPCVFCFPVAMLKIVVIPKRALRANRTGSQVWDEGPSHPSVSCSKKILQRGAQCVLVLHFRFHVCLQGNVVRFDILRLRPHEAPIHTLPPREQERIIFPSGDSTSAEIAVRRGDFGTVWGLPSGASLIFSRPFSSAFWFDACCLVHGGPVPPGPMLGCPGGPRSARYAPLCPRHRQIHGYILFSTLTQYD